MIKLLLWILAILLSITLIESSNGANLQAIQQELYLCNHIGHVVTGKSQGFMYFECFGSLDSSGAITTEYKTLLVFSSIDMQVVEGWKY